MFGDVLSAMVLGIRGSRVRGTSIEALRLRKSKEKCTKLLIRDLNVVSSDKKLPELLSSLWGSAADINDVG